MRQMVLGTLALVALTQTSAPAARAACAGADPAIVSAAVKGMTSDGRVNKYAVSIRVVNLGRMNQPSNLLQSVEIWQNDIKLDMKGLPPLKAGQSYTFSYVYQRSTDAGQGTSDLALRLTMRQPSPPGNMDCNPNNDRATVTF
jgi:hypothetical protein